MWKFCSDISRQFFTFLLFLKTFLTFLTFSSCWWPRKRWQLFQILLQMVDRHWLHWIHSPASFSVMLTFDVTGLKSCFIFQRICRVNSAEKTLNGAWHLCKGKIKPKCNRNKGIFGSNVLDTWVYAAHRRLTLAVTSSFAPFGRLGQRLCI